MMHQDVVLLGINVSLTLVCARGHVMLQLYCIICETFGANAFFWSVMTKKQK